jgi:hypothetical protein
LPLLPLENRSKVSRSGRARIALAKPMVSVLPGPQAPQTGVRENRLKYRREGQISRNSKLYGAYDLADVDRLATLDRSSLVTTPRGHYAPPGVTSLRSPIVATNGIAVQGIASKMILP